MNFLEYQRMVVAYHGCDRAVVESVMAGGSLEPSENDYDWLGTGVYFWEQGPGRALDWAHFMKKRGKISKPAVLGAVMQLGTCLDLLAIAVSAQLEAIYPLFRDRMSSKGLPLPQNDKAKKLHRLDCAFLNWAIPILETSRSVRFHSVRGVFVEGDPIYPGAQIHKESHIQLGVRDPKAIIGYFLPAKG